MDNIRKSFIIITVLTILYGIYYWGVPALINIDKRMPNIEGEVYKKTGYKISVKDPYIKMGHLPSVWIMAENISLLNDDGSKALNLEHSALKIYLLPLIAGKIHIGNFSSDKIDINLFYTKDSKLKLGQYLIGQMPESNMSLSKAYFRMGDYKVKLNDQKQNKNILLDGNYLTIDEFQNDKRIKLSTFAKLFVDKKASEIMADVDVKLPINKISEDQFKVNGRITNLNLADFSEYARAIPESKIESLSGIINMITETTSKPDKHKNVFAKITIDNLGILQKEKAKSIYCDNKIEIKTDIDTIKNGINVRNLKILSKGIDINVKGKASKLDAKNPNVNINVAINKSRTESFIPLLPGYENLIEEVNFYALKNNFFYGDITGNLNIKGKIATPDITGKILVTEGYLNKPLPNNTEKATIKLTFNGTNLSMDVKVPASKKETVFVNGDVNLYGNKDADLYIKSTPNVDLKIAQTVLNPLHEILRFDLGPVPIMKISGKGNINLHVIGTRKNPHGWGEFNFKETTASFIDIHNMVLQNGSGKLIFDDQNTNFSTTTAILNGKNVEVKGTCTLKGVLDFKITAIEQDLANLLKIIKTSPMLNDIQKLIAPINSAKGIANLHLNITGTVVDVNDVVFNKNIFAKGTIDLISSSINAQGINLSNISGKINFNNLNADINLNSNLDESKLKITGKLKDQNADIAVVSDKFVLKDGLKLLNLKIPYSNDVGKIHTSFISNYSGPVDKIDLNKLTVKGKIYPSKGPNLSVGNSTFELKNSRLQLSQLKGIFKGSPYFITLKASDIFDKKISVDGNFNITNFDLANIEDLKKYILPNPQEIKNISGHINLNGQIKDNAIYTNIPLKDISFVYTPANIKITFQSGSIGLQKNTLSLNKISSMFGEMPIFADGKIYSINKNPLISLYVNAKPTQEFADQFFNNRSVYPIKLKGDINVSSYLSGTFNALRNKSQLKLAENSSIYYMGATLGYTGTPENKTSNTVNIIVDSIIYPTGLKINNLQYDQLIPSQNNKIYTKTQLNASGNIGFLQNNDVKFYNFRVKTKQPTDAKIFNIIFRKPLMKQGIFTSDITINGTATAPVIIGKLNINSIDMPLLDATINDIDLDFKKDLIYLKSKGTILTNDLNISAIIRNNPKPPIIFEDIKVNLANLDLNKIITTFQEYEAESSRNLTTTDISTVPDFSSFIVKNANIDAQNIKIKNLNATDFTSNLSLNKDGLFNVHNFKFHMADGIVKGSLSYNLKNSFSNIALDVQKANAQIISETLFDLKGQIYGYLTGDINLSCVGKNHDSCMSTLQGNTSFDVSEGRMPKLGSLEYLLKAGNLIKGGITGLSINGIIDLITPYKTGNFDSINGKIHIINGIADDIQIFSAGKDLNMYMRGSYNFTNLIADMQIFGALTKNFSTLFGKIGNASLNTLFNTIPGINVSEAPSVITDDIKKIPNNENNTARIFAVDIYGDINGDDYVRSFKWLK